MRAEGPLNTTSRNQTLKTALSLNLILVPLLFAPILLEQFESIKAAWIVSFAFLSVGFIRPSAEASLRLLKPLDIGMLGFLASAILSAIFALDPHVAFYGNAHTPAGVLQCFALVTIYFLTKKTFTTYWDKREALALVSIPTLLASIYAVAQAAGLDFTTWKGLLSQQNYSRPIATFGHPNFLAAYLVMALPIVNYSLRISREERGARSAPALLHLATLVLSMAIIFLTQSRGAWLAALIVCFCMWRLHIRKLAIAALIALPLITAIMLASPTLRESSMDRMLNILAPGPARLEYLAASLRIWKKYPLLGAGTDNFEIAFNNNRTAAYWKIEPAGSPKRAHNDFLNLLATQGIIGALAGLGVLIGVLCTYFHSGALSSALIQSMLGFFLCGLTGFYTIPTGLLFVTILGMWGATEGRSETPISKKSSLISLLAGFIPAIYFVALPLLASCFTHLAIVFSNSNYNSSILLFEAAKKMTPRDSKIYTFEGNLLLKVATHTPDESSRVRYLGWASTLFERATQLSPAISLNHFYLAESLNKSNPLRSVREAQNACILEPANPYFISYERTLRDRQH